MAIKAAQYVAVSIDGEARFFGLGSAGVGHVLIIPAGFQGDPLAIETNEKGCGGKGLESARLSERSQGDKLCTRCVKWLATTGGQDSVLGGRADYPGSDIAAPEVREDSAPDTLPGLDVIASTGKTLAQMNAETAEFYANGGKPSPEIAALPAPGTVSLGMATESGTDARVMVCEFKGDVPVINPEKTHGKCPGCSAYIPLLPGKGEREESGPKVSKIACASVGSAPAPGTQVLRDDHTVSVADDYNGKTSAPCPGCARMIAVSREGGMRRHNGVTVPEAREESADRIGTHNVGGVATPASKGLTSKSVETVEHGSVPGDPASADKRRAAEIGKGADNRAGEAKFKGGADVGATVAKGARLALSRGHGSIDGAANTGSQNMAPVQPGGWLGKAGTTALPAMVRPGIDPEVVGKICPLPECKGQTVDIAHKGMTRSARRRHSAKVGAVLRERAERRETARAAEIAEGKAIPVAERRARRKAASVGSFAEGVNAHTGHVTHAARPAKGETSGKRKTNK
jgi:hypothetical protein